MKSSFECKICGASAVHLNYGVIACPPCKMFFKRNAEKQQERFVCDFDGHCDVNILNRHVCSACRLAKCFANGMTTDLIRCALSKSNIRRRKKQKMMTVSMTTTSESSVRRHGEDRCEQLPTLNVLQLDQTPLTINQRNLLSNLIHCYDQYSGLSLAQRFKDEQSALPLKLRFRSERLAAFLTSNMIHVQHIFERNSDHRSLCLQDRSTLLRTTVKHTGCIGATFILHQVHLLHDPFFYKSNEVIFGSDVMSTMIALTQSFDCDAIFVKLIHFIVAFSTTRYTVYSDTTTTTITTTTTTADLIDLRSVLQIQDTYTELAWQYMIYKYSYEQAVIRFSDLIRCLFRLNVIIVEVDRTHEYQQMISTVVEHIEQTLTNAQ